ncbi:MAG: SUF system Fe-S cluster assembly regulator [Gammaproteobacteria bacterium]|nr:SUF system Fe-S cluster assembly regulator [Gammaproteobacteria bacterium]
MPSLGRRGSPAWRPVKGREFTKAWAPSCGPKHVNSLQLFLIWTKMVPFMIRISRMTDYATVLLAALARDPEACLSAPALAERTRIGMPTVSKVLKILQRGGLVRSTRGLHGGYSLARPAQTISAAAILDALEGPVAVTDCSAGQGHCEIETTCGVGQAWQRVNLAIRRSLYDVSLAQLAGLDTQNFALRGFEQQLNPAIGGRAAAALRRDKSADA